MRHEKGFTLLEVLVALSVFALSIFALTGSMRQSFFAHERSKLQILSALVAANVLQEVSVLPDIAQTGQVNMGNQIFNYTLNSSEGMFPYLQKIVVVVSPEGTKAEDGYTYVRYVAEP